MCRVTILIYNLNESSTSIFKLTAQQLCCTESTTDKQHCERLQCHVDTKTRTTQLKHSTAQKPQRV